MNHSAETGTTYGFRVVEPDDTALDTSTVVPEITTAVSRARLAPSASPSTEVSTSERRNRLGGSGAADDDFHLQSLIGSYKVATGSFSVDQTTSQAIDAGDPADAFANEPAPHGDRVNIGRYGNTTEASKSTAQRIPRGSGTGMYPALY